MEAHGPAFRSPHNLTPLMLAARAGNVELVEKLIDRGADLALHDSRGWTAFLHALDEGWRNPAFSKANLPRLARLLAPESLSLEAGGRLVKLDQRQGEFFLLHSFLTLLPWTMPIDPETGGWPGLTAPGLAKLFQELPTEVLPGHRQKRAYVSAMLARHERSRNAGGHPLFWRTERGVYAFDPQVKLRIGETFRPVYDLLFPAPIRPHGPVAIREFIESPTTFRPPSERYLEKMRAHWAAEDAKRKAEHEAILAKQSEWAKEWRDRREQEKAARMAAKEARAERARKRAEAKTKAQAEVQLTLFEGQE